MDYCSTTAGASLVAHPYPESLKIVAWAIPSGWSGTRKLSRNTVWLKSVLPCRAAFTNCWRQQPYRQQLVSTTSQGMFWHVCVLQGKRLHRREIVNPERRADEAA